MIRPTTTRISLPAGMHAERNPPSIAATGLPRKDILIGTNKNESHSYGVFAKTVENNRRVAIDQYETHVASLFGFMGKGKSNSINVWLENCTTSVPNASCHKRPHCAVVFHYVKERVYRPEAISITRPQSGEWGDRLQKEWGITPSANHDVVILAPNPVLEERRAEYEADHVQVQPLFMSLQECTASHVRMMMGATGTSLLVRVMNMIIRQIKLDNEQRKKNGQPLRELSLDAIESEIQKSGMSEFEIREAQLRIQMARGFIDAQAPGILQYMRPGRVIIVDLRDETLFEEDAFALMVVIMQVLSEATINVNGITRPMTKTFFFDEAHGYIRETPQSRELLEVIECAARTRRHRAVSLVFASQDPGTFPTLFLQLSDIVGIHGFNSRQWLERIQHVLTPFAHMEPHQMAELTKGQMYLWSAEASEPVYTHKPHLVLVRPSACAFGGGTVTAD